MAYPAGHGRAPAPGQLNLEFDGERKPVTRCLELVDGAAHLSFDTVPWRTPEQGQRAWALWDGCRAENCLQTLQDCRLRRWFYPARKPGAGVCGSAPRGVLRRTFLRADVQGRWGARKTIMYTGVAEPSGRGSSWVISSPTGALATASDPVMKASDGDRAPWRVVLPVLVGGAITAMAWAALNPPDSGDGFLSGNGRVQAAGNDDHRTRKQGVTAAVTLVRLTHVASTAQSTPKPVVETASERQQWMLCDKAGTSRELGSKESTPPKTGNGQPAMIETKDLKDFQELPAGRRKLVESAIAVARNWPWLPYIYGGADPASGGFDCSGAMYYVMTRVGLTPPRTAAGQYVWLRDHERLRIVPNEATTAGHSSLAWLRPGDLLFWSTDHPADHAKIVNITHVAMYLGREKRDGLQVMANATDGRSYRGTKANGYGVYEFRLSREGSKSKLVGYGPPPGMTDIETPAAPVP